MPSILDSPSLSIRSIYIYYIILYTCFFQFSIPSLQMEVKQLQTLQAHSLAIPNLSQLHVCYGVMHRERVFQACCCRKNKREREREEKKTVVWCQNEDAGHMIISMQCMHFCIYLKLSFEHTMLNARNSLIHMIHTRYIYVE